MDKHAVTGPVGTVAIAGLIFGAMIGYAMAKADIKDYKAQIESLQNELTLKTNMLEALEPTQFPIYKEPDIEEQVLNVLGEISTANITIHIKNKDGTVADFHIFWNK